MNVAIIVAAGAGKRFGGVVPKQFLEIHGKPLIVHTLEKFENCLQVDETVLVLPASETANFAEICKKYNLKKLVKIVAGGATRDVSVWNGFKTIDAARTKIVAVHDGARPLVSVEEISVTIEKAFETGAACLVAPVTDTIKEVADGKIVRTIDRSKLRRALTPQCFRYEILHRAFTADIVIRGTTDESSLVERFGVTVTAVEGSARNVKITRPEDFALAEILLKA